MTNILTLHVFFIKRDFHTICIYDECTGHPLEKASYTLQFIVITKITPMSISQ